jgi:hypothetical protein
MRRVILSMSISMSLDGDRQHPGAVPEDQELVHWKLEPGAGWARAGRATEDG